MPQREERSTLFYIHDPMCSWCWAFNPAFTALKNQLPDTVDLKYLLGGLAADSHEPMAQSMQLGLQQIWKQIQHTVPNTVFNFDFWTKNTPLRSTWPACRAVIAAREQQVDFEHSMIQSIQRAYYLEAKNPSEKTTLLELAVQIGCNGEQFLSALDNEATHVTLHNEMRFSQRLGVRGFPSLVMQSPSANYHGISINYLSVDTMLSEIQDVL